MKIIRVEEGEIKPGIDFPAVERLLSGNPQRLTWPVYESTDGLVSVGLWSCEVGAWRIAFAAGKEEYFCVIRGKVCLHDENGEAQMFSAGEAAVIPAGFRGIFEVLEPVQKYYVIVSR